jgi:hypothetical protein
MLSPCWISTWLYLGILFLAAPVVSTSTFGPDATQKTSAELDDNSLESSSSTLLASAPDCKEWNANNRLECWLWQLQVDIPAQSFSADWITISIHDMVCTHFSLRNLHSDYRAPHSLELSVQSLQATCKGKYHASGGISGNVEAGVSAQSAKSLQALQVAFRVVPSTAYPLARPTTFQTTNCETHLKAGKIKFSGSMSARLIQAFSKTISHYISQALQEQLCPLLPKELDPLVTEYLHELDDWMKPYLPKNKNVIGGRDYDVYYQNATNAIQSPSSLNEGTRSMPTRKRRLGSTAIPQVVVTTAKYHNGDAAAWILATQNSTTTTTTTTTAVSVVNPIDWDVVHSALTLFNTELAEHLQQGWLFNSNTTDQYIIGPDQNKKCHNMFRGLSGWFRSIVGPKLTIPLPAYFHNISLPLSLPLQADVSLGLDHISIQGLDLLNMLQLFRPTALTQQANNNNTSQNTTALASLVSTTSEIRIEAPIALNIQMSSSKHALLEPFTVKLNVTEFDTLLTTTLKVMDWDQTSLLQVANAVQRFVEHPTPENIRPMLGCLIRTVANVDNLDWITSIIVDSITITRRTARFQNQSLDDDLEDDLDHVINTVLELLLGEYSELWTDLMRGLIRDPARHSLNDYLQDWLVHHSSADVCPPAVVPTTNVPKLLNFSKFLILDHFNEFLNHKSTLSTVNRYLECVGDYVEGYVAARATGNDATRRIHHTSTDNIASNQAPMQSLLEVVRVETKHWNAVKHVQLMQPTDDTTLESSIHWGTNTTVPQLHVTLQVDTEQLSGIVNLTLFAGLQARLATKVDYNLNRLENLTVAHLLQQVECGMVPAMELRLLPQATTANLGPWVGLNVSAVLNNQSISYSTNESRDSADNVADLAGSALEWGVEWGVDLVNKALEEWVLRSSDMCPGIVPSESVPDDHGDDNNSVWYDYPMIWIVIVLLVLGQGGLVGIVQGPGELAVLTGSSSAPNSLTVPLLSEPPEEDIMDPAPLENDVDDYARDMREMDQALLDDIRDTSAGEQIPMMLDEGTFVNEGEQEELKPLLTAHAVPEIVRFAIPMLIVATIILLFSSNISVGASVDMSIRVGDTPIHLPGLFEFSLGNTISELFGAGIYPLLFLVVVFSGIWPYAKLVWMFFIWNASYRDTLQREQRLLTLDALSKFSLVDTYVLVVMLVAFRFHLDLSEELGLDVYVTPEYGFYAFLLATCSSLMLGHGMLYFHRKADNIGHHHEGISDLIERKSIFDHAFDVEDNGMRRPLSHFFQVVIFASCLAAMVFLILGFGQESFAFEFGGLAGLALGDKSKTSYSLVSLGVAIPQSVEDSNSLGILFLQIAYYFYAVLTPVACLTLLMVLLLYPATPQIQKRLLVAAEIANAWSAVEVFVLSIVAALFQISTFASFIIGDKCDLVNQIATKLIGGDIIPADDAVCFRVVASVDSSCWYLVVGVLMNSFVASLVLRLAHAAVHERSGHGGGNNLVRQLFGLPIGVVFFGPGLVEDILPEEGGTQEEEGEGQEEEEENAPRPEWSFWF